MAIIEVKQVRETITRREFLQRIGEQKYSELIDLSESNSLVKAKLEIINADKSIWLLSPEYKSWFDSFVVDGVFTQQEMDEIFKI